MAIATRRQTPVQERIIRENFERMGPFLLSRDLHAMLDCACPPERMATVGPGGGPAIGLDLPLASHLGPSSARNSTVAFCSTKSNIASIC